MDFDLVYTIPCFSDRVVGRDGSEKVGGTLRMVVEDDWYNAAAEPWRMGVRAASPAIVAIAFLALFTTGCEMFRSDAQNSTIQSEKRRKAAVSSMQAATAQTPRGVAVSGEELVALVSGTTHVFEYESAPGGRRGKYVVEDSFAPGGAFVFRTSEGLKYDGTWRVDGPRLCIVNPYYSSDERCFTIAKTKEGRIQYYIADPGDYEGLLTKVTDEVRRP